MKVDIAIKGGSVIDGSGQASFSGDVGITDGVIVQVGGRIDRASQTIDADGAIVTPGFVDIHTHYDGQFLWDETLEPSFSHGVTTVVAGNCGVGFAPAGEQHRRELIELMEGVEDIPGIVLDEGLDWNWRSFPDFLDRLDARSYTMDIGIQMAHAPLRVFVLGERALTHQQATAADIEVMAQLVEQAMAAGAMGISSGRILEHKSKTGGNVPGTFAEQDELVALAAAMGRGGHGTFQIIPLGAVGSGEAHEEFVRSRKSEHARIEELAAASGRPTTYLLQQFPSDLDDWRTMLELTAGAVEGGLDIRPQTSARAIGTLSMLDSHHIFKFRPTYLAIAHLPLPARAAALRDPTTKAAILEEENSAAAMSEDPASAELVTLTTPRVGNQFMLDLPLDYEPGPERRLSAIATARGVTPAEVLYDHLAAGDGGNVAASFFLNYGDTGLNAVHDMLQNPLVANGLGDGGAHMRMSCDASMPTFMLTFWGRDRKRGPRLPLELLVHKLTRDGALLYGLTDRGLLREGMRADINVIDHAQLVLTRPEMIFDLPSGGGRILQGSAGYVATIVKGVATRLGDADTGARPGALVRSAP